MVSPSKEARDEDARQYGASQDEIDHLFPNRPRNHGQTFRFSELYLSLFNPLSECRRGGHSSGPSKISPHERRRKIIARFIDRWRSQVGNDFYPALRLILPDKDRERSTYGLKESNIGKLLVKVLMIDRNSEDGQALLRWKLPGGGGARGGAGGGAGFRGPPSLTAGDFASRCREVLKRREMRSEPGDLTVADVNEQLDRLAAASGEAENLAVIRHLHSRMNSDEMVWAISIILRQLRIGATEKTILDVWHPSAEPLFTVSSSLRRVCWELPDREVVLPEADAGLALMQCFQPQLAQFQISASFEKMVRRLVGGEGGGGTGDGEGGGGAGAGDGAGGEGGGGSQGGAAVEGSDGGGGREFWIEEKLDGERMQMHMAEDPDAPGGRRFGWWSRKGKEYTYLYGRGLRDPDSAITRHLDDDCFAAGVRDLILDGEMVTWDPKTGKLVAFGTLKTAAISERVATSQDLAAFSHAGGGGGGGDEPRPVFRVFDIVYLNGTDLTRYTLRDRRRALAGAVRGAPRRLEIHPYVATTSADEIEPQLRTIVAESSEGLVLKNPSSPYRLGRRADDWLKVKPEYMAEFGENLDCVIVGGYYGSGRRGGTLSSFMCGLRAGRNQAVAGVAVAGAAGAAAATTADSAAGTSPEKCWSFCKVGGGLRAEDYAEIGRLTEGRWRDWDPRRPPAQYLELAGGSGPTGRQLERPDVWIRPSESVVIEIKATSVGPSNQFALGKTLRFPRFRRIRPDKRWDQGLDIDEFELLARNAVEEREQKTMEMEDRRRRAKRVRRERVIVGVDPDAPPAAAAATGPSDSTAVFAGLEFCVLTGVGRRLTKGQLEAIIRRSGGAVAQRAAPLSAQIIVAEKLVVKAASLIKAGDVDMVKPKWVTDCVAQGSVLPYEEAHLFHATATTRAAADASTDRYGDSYAREVSVAELREILVDMPKLERFNCGPPDRRVLLNGLVQDGGVLPPTHGLMFDQCAVHFVNADPRSMVRLVQLQNYVRFGGGVITPELEPSVTTHVVIVLPSGAGAGGDMQMVMADAVAAAKAAGAAAGATGPVVVVGSWVETCWREGARVEEEDFEAG